MQPLSMLTRNQQNTNLILKVPGRINEKRIFSMNIEIICLKMANTLVYNYPDSVIFLKRIHLSFLS